eukprot:COSAG02_NODE_60536_length_271_cov_0.598837_1_plen_34_part_10
MRLLQHGAVPADRGEGAVDRGVLIPAKGGLKHTH